MIPRQTITERREALGIQDTIIAAKLGITISSYDDIEAYDDEIFSTVELSVIKKLCELLKLDFFELFSWQCSFCGEHKPHNAWYTLPRNDLIQRSREMLGISQHELADRLGFEDVAVEDMEKEEDFLESWTLDLIENLSKELKIPFQILASVRCSKCGK